LFSMRVACKAVARFHIYLRTLCAASCLWHVMPACMYNSVIASALCSLACGLSSAVLYSLS
jgi:hypothetical protein